MKNIIILAAGAVLMATSCVDMFSPAPELNRSLEDMLANPDYAQGLLGYAYGVSPFQTKSESDVATDDAVTNDINNAYLYMATGAWSPFDDPTNQWDARQATISNLNTFLANVDKVEWTANKAIQKVYRDRLWGEAHGLRALNMYYLLRAHGGWATDGRLLGFPIVTDAPDAAKTDFNVPRNTYQECVDQILSDLRVAIDMLPSVYADIPDGHPELIPARYPDLKEEEEYNRAAGYQFMGRLDGNTARAIYAQVLLMAASPAFGEGTTVTWEDAANAAAQTLAPIEGLAGLATNGHTWYMNKSEINPGSVPKELLWTGNATNGQEDWNVGLDQEVKNFPPSLYGSGRINPSQNLVDAFPMANGYPIGSAESGYNANDPYTGRDPRLGQYIMYNGMRYKDTDIITGTYATNSNGLNQDQARSTRTGYYLKKLLRDDVNANPSSRNAQYHYPVRIRFTEIFLAYAEAANEAWGPTGSGSHGYSAYDVIKAIRSRAGVGADNGDAYLESVKGDQARMRELIRNERRLELCFENKRFWDIRRWNLPLNETVKGMQIDQNADGSLTYTVIDVENRDYLDYMRFGPVPNAEILRFSNLQQNKGW